MRKELKEITLLKTLMMILVVLYHSCLFFNGSWFKCVKPVYSANYINYFTFILNTFHIQTFIFASGFLFFYLISIGKYKNIKENLLNKSKRLLIPLFSTIIFWVIPFHIFYFGFDFKSLIKNYLLLEQPSQLWFLPMLFLIFVIFSYISKKLKFSFKELMLIFVASNLIGGILQLFGINYFNIANALLFSIYFYLGGFVFKNKDKFNNRNKFILFFITATLLIYVLHTRNINIKILKYINKVIISAFSCLEATCLYFLCDYLINKKNIKIDTNIYKLLSENSFGIYLFHQQIIYITITVFNGMVHPVVQCVLSFIISMFVSLFLTSILKKFKMTNQLFGL